MHMMWHMNLVELISYVKCHAYDMLLFKWHVVLPLKIMAVSWSSDSDDDSGDDNKVPVSFFFNLLSSLLTVFLFSKMRAFCSASLSTVDVSHAKVFPNCRRQTHSRPIRESVD